tara:strand:+ start:527 stop:844 length:318 start_codon:yes stop_codon:yes gene_type:complete
LRGFFFVSRSNPELVDAIQIGFERAIDDGSYQALVERLLITPWLRQNPMLVNRTVLVFPNPVATAVLTDVDPKHWIVRWGDLLHGHVSSGSPLCETESLRVLCES